MQRPPESIRQECAAGGERLLADPERDRFLGSTGDQGRVRGADVTALSTRRLAFRTA